MVKKHPIPICIECGNEIFNFIRKNQKFCGILASNCSSRWHGRISMRKRNGTKPENYMGRNWGK